MNQSRQRLMFMAYVVLIAFVLLSGRFFYLQTFKAEHLQKKVVEQRVKEIVEQPERGRIVDRNGDVMAFSLMAKDIALYPNLITGKSRQEAMAELLSKELDMPYNEVMNKIRAKDSKGNPLQWVSLAKRVDIDVAKRIQEANLGGIEIKNSPKRYYPNGKTGGSILGFVNHEGAALGGIELSLDKNLRGVPGYRLAETDSVGKIIPIGFENISTALDGQTVHLTTDNYLQHVVEDALKQTKKELKATKVHAVLMNPNDGSILAMASAPSFDPNNYSKSKQSTWTLNPATYVYEPGSTFKPIYMAAAMDAGHITKDFTYEDAGSINVNGVNIRNWDGQGPGKATLQDVIVNSSNVGMINISRTMTSEQTIKGLRKAGIGQKTGIELPGEEIGLFPTAKSLDDDPIRKATVSFGQGISVTPVQLLTAFSQIVNGGHEIKAHLVQNAKDQFGNITYQRDVAKGKQIYKADTVKNIKKYLKANMEIGSGKDYQLKGTKAGGKTGSAWFVENGKYVDGEIIGSFMGFVPYDKPKYALLVVVERPEAEFGSTAAGPTWKSIMEETLRYTKINELDEKAKQITVPDVRWMLTDDAKEVLKENLKNVVVKEDGDGEIVTDRRYRYKNDRLEITLVTASLETKKGIYIPNVTGKSRYQLHELFKGTGIKIKEHGQGHVSEQKLAPGYYEDIKEMIVWYK